MRTFCWLVVAAAVAAAGRSPAAEPLTEFRPDPVSVQRYGKGYRYPQAGWIVMHAEGEPYERGEQHGRLLAAEIAGYVHCCGLQQSAKSPEDAWKVTRAMINALFVRQFEPEYLEEMKGIADGAAAAGAKFDGRPIDLTDIVALNVWPEIDSIEASLEALPTGLEGKIFPHTQPRRMPTPPEGHCSAFAATGPATADGKVVFGHITMWTLRPTRFFNVWLDIKPAKGHRVMMQAFPGGIQSGMDYYQSSSGLLMTETTIRQTKFDIKGLALAGRIRKALQYANSIDEAVDILKASNNGLYTNEWLMADTKTNEVAMFELGTESSRLYRSSKGEWFGGTEGFYWGCNNTKDLQVRLETIPGVNGRPENMVWKPSDRDKLWQRLYSEHKGKIDADFGRLAFTTPPLSAYRSLDAKYTTSDMTKRMQTWALYGPPLGRTWEPTRAERAKFPTMIRPLVSNPWTVMGPEAPADGGRAVAAADLHDRVKSDSSDDDSDTHTTAAWNGTILPKTDADIWLAAAFAEYERIVALEKALNANGKLTTSERDRLAVALNAARLRYMPAARSGGDVPLARTRQTPGDEWYRVASGKGILVLSELREAIGAEKFCDIMDAFGRANAGKEVTVSAFAEHLAKATGRKWDDFFGYWLDKPGLPDLKLERATVQAHPVAGAGNGGGSGDGFRVIGSLRQDGGPRRKVAVTMETAKDETTRLFDLEGTNSFTFETAERPLRVTVDKYNRSAKANGGPYAISSFEDERERTMIVYGTRDEEAANRETALALQEKIRSHWSNQVIPVKADRDVGDEELRERHLLLIGRPDTNRIVEQFRDALPITFGWRSFVVRGVTYAHAGSAILVSTENPLNPRYSTVVLAGLSADATTQTPNHVYDQDGQGANVLILPNGGKTKAIVAPARQLVKEFKDGE
jgi:hypothetical protein